MRDQSYATQCGTYHLPPNTGPIIYPGESTACCHPMRDQSSISIQANLQSQLPPNAGPIIYPSRRLCKVCCHLIGGTISVSQLTCHVDFRLVRVRASDTIEAKTTKTISNNNTLPRPRPQPSQTQFAPMHYKTSRVPTISTR